MISIRTGFGILASGVAFLLVGVHISGATAEERDPEMSPLAAYLGFGYSSDVADEVYESEERERQAVIVACMRSHGFDYWPVAPGVVIVDEEDVAELTESAAQPDRNEEYLQALSPEEMDRYRLALSGRTGESDGITADEMRELDENADGQITYAERERMGCMGKAEHAVPGVFHAAKLLSDDLQAMDASIQQDARVAAAQRDWVECVSPDGSLGDTYSQVNETLFESSVDQSLEEGSEAAATVQACDPSLDSVVRDVRVEAESAFFVEHRETLGEFGYPNPEYRSES